MAPTGGGSGGSSRAAARPPVLVGRVAVRSGLRRPQDGHRRGRAGRPERPSRLPVGSAVLSARPTMLLRGSPCFLGGSPCFLGGSRCFLWGPPSVELAAADALPRKPLSFGFTFSFCSAGVPEAGMSSLACGLPVSPGLLSCGSLSAQLRGVRWPSEVSRAAAPTWCGSRTSHTLCVLHPGRPG